MSGGIIRPGPESREGWSDSVQAPTDTATWNVEIRHGRVVIRYMRSNLSMPVDVVLPVGFLKMLAAGVLQAEAQQMGNYIPPLPGANGATK